MEFVDDTLILNKSEKALQQNLKVSTSDMKKDKIMAISKERRSHDEGPVDKYLGTGILTSRGKINEPTEITCKLFRAIKTIFIGKRKIPEYIKR